MTKEELLKQQLKNKNEDINILTKRLLDNEQTIEFYKQKFEEFREKYHNTPVQAQGILDRKYQFDNPYFRIDAYGISCYALIAYEECHWRDNAVNPYYRFRDVFGIYLDDQHFGEVRPDYGGRRSLTTCISYDDLIKKLKARASKNHKGNGSEYAALIDTLNKELLNHKAWFGKFVETLAI